MRRGRCRGSMAVKPTAAFRQPLIKTAIRAVDLGEVRRSSRARRWPGAVAGVLRRLLVGTWAGVQVIGRGSAVSRVNALTRSPAQGRPSAMRSRVRPAVRVCGPRRVAAGSAASSARQSALTDGVSWDGMHSGVPARHASKALVDRDIANSWAERKIGTKDDRSHKFPGVLAGRGLSPGAQPADGRTRDRRTG